jgi:hypothetical protein
MPLDGIPTSRRLRKLEKVALKLEFVNYAWDFMVFTLDIATMWIREGIPNTKIKLTITTTTHL